MGLVQETSVIEHRIMVPPGIKGEIVSLNEGDYTVVDKIGEIKTEKGIEDLTLMQKMACKKGQTL